jgi:hypothetical protein
MSISISGWDAIVGRLLTLDRYQHMEALSRVRVNDCEKSVFTLIFGKQTLV